MKQHELLFIVPILIWMKPKEFVLPILHQSTGCSKITAIPNHWANGSNKSLIRVAVAFPVTHDSVAGFPDNSWEMVVQNYSSDRASINSCGMETKPSKKEMLARPGNSPNNIPGKVMARINRTKGSSAVHPTPRRT